MKQIHALIGVISALTLGVLAWKAEGNPRFPQASGRPQQSSQQDPPASPTKGFQAPGTNPKHDIITSSCYSCHNAGYGPNTLNIVPRPDAPPPPYYTGSNSPSTGSQTSTSNSNGQYPYNTYPYGYPYSGWTTGFFDPTANTNPPAAPPATPPVDPAAPLITNLPDPAPAAQKSSPTTAPSDTAAEVDPALTQARAALDAAIGRLKETLKSNPAYTAALNDKQAAQDEVSALRAKGDDGQVLAVAQRGLEASQRISQIEREAIARDADVIAARARFAAALAAHSAARGGTAAQASPLPAGAVAVQ